MTDGDREITKSLRPLVHYGVATETAKPAAFVQCMDKAVPLAIPQPRDLTGQVFHLEDGRHFTYQPHLVTCPHCWEMMK